MAIKRAQKSLDNSEQKRGIAPSEDLPSSNTLDEIPDFDFGDALAVDIAPKAVNQEPQSMQGAFLAEADKHPCYGDLVSPVPDEVHWHARQVQAEIKVVLRGFSRMNRFWREDIADRLINYPCGLEENGFVLSWVCPEEDWDARNLLQDVREHMKWAFGDSFIVRPVSDLSEDAKGWKFNLGS